MKRLPLVILVFAVLAAVVAGCSHSARYDGRLVAADSLMQVNPDSALAIVEGLCRDRLPDEGNRAYRDLLLTQARYRCYITATSDSDINRALAYYRAHPREREKLTRANIYKGAVMDELGFPDSAMLYYKQAESVADTADYFNLGYVKMRMGTLYRDHYSFDGLPEQKFEEAIECFKRTDEKHYLLLCSIDLAALYRLNDERGAQDLYAECMSLASELKDTVNYAICLKGLTGLYYFCKRYEQGRVVSQRVMKNFSNYIDESFCCNASKIYAKSGMLDSARYFLNLVGDVNRDSPIQRTTYLECLSELALAQKDTLEHLRLGKELDDIVDSLMVDKKRQQILAIENEFEKGSKAQFTKRQKRKVLLLTSLVFLTMLIAAALIYRNRHRYSQLINDLMEQAIASLEERQRHATDPDINSILRLRLSAIQELYQDIRIRIDDENKVRKVVPLSSFLKMMHERNALLDLKLKDSFWNKMRTSVDQELNGIVTYVEQHYTELTQRDIQFFCLFCAGISPQIIKMCMNIASAKTATNYRTLIIKKMGLDMSFDEFIDGYMAGNLK